MTPSDRNEADSNHQSDYVNEQHALLAAIVNSSDDAIIGSDLCGNILSWNHAAEILFGYSATAIYQRPFASLFPAGQLPDHLSLIKLMQQGASIGHFETMRRCQDGTELPVALTISAMRDEGDNIIGLSLIARDFSVGYRMAARLTQSERHFRQVVDAAPNAMVMIDRRGLIEMVNSQTETIFGYTRTELLGKPLEILIPSRFQRHHPSLRTGYFANPVSRVMGQGRELYGLRKDGTEFPVEIGLNPIETADGIKVLSAIVDITERKRQEERFRLVVEAAPNAMVMIDNQGMIEMVNTQTEEIFGYEREELLGQPMEILIPERFRHHHPGLRTHFFSQPSSRSMGTGRDLFGLRKDGTEFPVEIGLNPIETADGLKVLSSIVDISERKRLEERFRLVVEAAPNAMVMIDSQGMIEMVNAQTEEIFGYEREELLGQPMEVLIPARFRAHHPGLRTHFFAHPSSRTMGSGRDLFGLRKDGTEFPVEIGLNPIETADGLKVLSAIVDISERKRQEERFRLVVEAAPNAMVMIDSRGMIEMVNAQTEHLFGYQRAELLGQPMEVLIPARFRPQHPGLRTGYFSSPSTRAMGTGRDLFGLRKDGSEFQIEIGLNPIQTADGLKVLSAIVDISERKRFTDELSRRNQELNNFAYVASHDLKSPLRGVDQLATWLTEDLAGKIDDDTNEHLRLMRVRIKRMERLLDDLLLYFRAGQLGGTVEHIDFADLVRDVFDLCCPDQSFSLELQGDFPRCHTHKVPLELVFRNLISNAIKHHDTKRGCIAIHSIPNDQWLEFAVCDDGPGIAAEHNDRVFAMFQTLRPRDEVEGSGMGLAIIKKTIESLGGNIKLSANQPRGAMFKFTWPRNTAEAL